MPLEAVYGRQSAQFGAVLPPLGLFYLASALRGTEHEAHLLDANALRLGPDAVAARVVELGCDCLGITVTSLAYPYAMEVARAVKTRAPGVKLLLGGPHAQGDHAAILADTSNIFDYVCYGEGEYALASLLDYLSGAFGEESLRGWVFLRDGRTVKTPEAEIPLDLDVFGHPSDLLPPEWVNLYQEKLFAYKRLPMFSLMSSRGCPFKCTFCSTPRRFRDVYKGRLRFHSVDWLLQEMETLAERFGVHEVNLVDDTFNVSRERVLEFCRRKVAAGLKTAWACNFEANIADREMLAAMKEAGCWSIMVGAESGADEMLEFIKKGVTSEQLLQVARWANEVGIASRYSFILGLPTETKATLEKTMALIERSDIHFPYFQLYVPLPGTEMYENLSEYGTILEKDARDRSAGSVNYLPHGLTEEYLQEFFNKAFKRAYLRPRMVKNHLKFVRSPRDVARYWQGLKALLLG